MPPTRQDIRNALDRPETERWYKPPTHISLGGFFSAGVAAEMVVKEYYDDGPPQLVTIEDGPLTVEACDE